MIRFHFDFVSPYAYLAWTQVHALAARHGEEVEPVPVLFAKVLEALGSRAPVANPPRRAYIVKDSARQAALLGVPLWPPPEHPFNPLAALRLASVPLDAAVRRRLVDALFQAAWAGGDGIGIADPAQVAAIGRAAGVPEAALAAAAGDEIKLALRRQTSDLLTAGGFGVPTLTCRGELFFGLDSLPALERFLEGKDPVTPALIERWRAVARVPQTT